MYDDINTKILSALSNIEKNYNRGEILNIKTSQDHQTKELSEIRSEFKDLRDVISSNKEKIFDNMSIRPTWGVLIPLFMILIGFSYFLFNGINNNTNYINHHINAIESQIDVLEDVIDGSISRIESDIRKNRLSLDRVVEKIEKGNGHE